MSARMRLVVDCRYTTLGRHNGISRYGAEMARSLAKLADVTMLISDERQLEMLPDLPWLKTTSERTWHEVFIAWQINPLKPDAMFSPMQMAGSWRRRYGLVLTLHDLIYYRQRTPPPDQPWFMRLSWRVYHLWWWPQRAVLSRADKVVTVSETTRELMAEHHLTRDPVAVIPNAAADAPGAARAVPESRDLLYMGTFWPYKNVETLARAMHRLPGYRLHLLSRISAKERARIEPLAPPESLVFHNGASDEEYARLLDGATALLHASLDEGFGIPIVEAMAAGTPVVASDIPVFREVGGDAVAYVPPKDASAFAREILALEDPERWLAASRAAQQRAAGFSWDASARALMDVLEQAAERRRRHLKR